MAEEEEEEEEEEGAAAIAVAHSRHQSKITAYDAIKNSQIPGERNIEFLVPRECRLAHATPYLFFEAEV